MYSPAVSKQSLGTSYVVATGVILSLGLGAHLIAIFSPSFVDLVIISVGLAPALLLVGAYFWLPRSGLDGEQIWTAAEWCGLGVAVFTVINIVVLLSPIPSSSMVPSILASGVAVGGFGGILVGGLLEIRRSRRRLAQSNDVLFRVLRHDLRNDLNVVLGHLGKLDQTATPESRPHVNTLQETVDDLITTTEKARRIEFAFDSDRRSREPVDLIPFVREQAAILERSYPDVQLELDLPEQAMVYGDWLLGTVLENLLENAVVHCEDTPSLYISVREEDQMVTVHISDNCPSIPQHELDVLDSKTETQLHHSKGIGLWLTTWIVESYGGQVKLATTEDGNTVTLELRGVTRFDSLSWFQ